MDKEEAKLILGCYHPNGKDALNPEMRQALELAERDPELAAWFKREQELDGIICEKIGQIRAPESLKTSIIAGRKLVHLDARWKSPKLLALAAMLVAIIGTAVVLVSTGKDDGSAVVVQQGFEQFREEMVQIVQAGLELDLYSGNSEELEMWLMKHSTPLINSESTRNLASHAMGCKALDWGGKPVSLVCYRMGEGKVVHLFVMDLQGEAVGGLPRQQTTLLESVHQRSTASWQENGKAYLLVGHDPGTKLTPYL